MNFPQGLQRISTNAFQGCSNLKRINLPEGLNYLSGFSECSSLVELKIPTSVRLIGERAFAGCTKLKKVEIPKDTNIGWFSFTGCIGLKELIIHGGDGVIISSFAFSDCTGLSKVIIENTIDSIKDGAFSNCSSLTEIRIPSGTRDLEGNNEYCKGAFEDCSCLTRIYIPNSVSVIKKGTFRNCIKLKDVYCEDKEPDVIWGAFRNCPRTLIIHWAGGSKSGFEDSQDDIENDLRNNFLL